ncbi:MAG: TrbG/VirB9 family P-type conjugative transfer protein [Anaerolineae bacterium]|nr:TrbG/VirB9 family P-type conjugative transfer protein [Anaerolineae bacterium]
MNLLKNLALVALAVWSVSVHAKQVDREEKSAARPVSQDTRLVLFNYDPNLTYTIHARDGLFTHIELPAGEKIQGFYISDTVRWKHHIAQNRERLFLKASASGLFNSATLVTNRRTYEITLRSGKEGDPWFQRVRWSVPDDDVPGSASGVFEPAEMLSAGAGMPANLSQAAMPLNFPSAISAGAPAVKPESLNFGYVIKGEAPFRPRMVFDDGKFTWLQLGTQQDLPAVFALTADDKAEVVDFTVHGQYLLVSRLVDGLLLKIGEQEVRISRGRKCSGLFGCGNE